MVMVMLVKTISIDVDAKAYENGKIITLKIRMTQQYDDENII